MDARNAVQSIVLLILLSVAGGCNKTQPSSSTPQSSQAENAPQTQTSAPAAKPVATPTNASATPITSKVAQEAATTLAPSQGSKPVVPEKVSAVTPAPAPVTASTTQATLSVASLSQDQVVRGLQEALAKGLQQAVTNLGHPDGFLTNVQVKIPLPEKLQKVQSLAQTLKQEKLVDDFVATMNRAAEQAVPAAAAVFANTLSHMSIDDARAILTGPNDAATQYFQRTTQTNLYEKFYPIVKQATANVGVTSAYKNLMEKVNPSNLSQKLGNLGSLGNTLSSSLLDQDSLDIDAYVTNKAMEGLFKIVAQEEKQIRQNPIARTTDLLQKVFGAVKN